MMKKQYKKLFSFVIMCIIMLTFCLPNIAASGVAKVYYNSGLSVGTTSAISGMLSNVGYSTSRANLPTVATLKSALNSAKIVHVLSHGGPGTTTCSNGSLSHTSIGSTSNLTFAFMETCYSAKPAANGLSTAGAIKSNGAKASLGFEETIIAVGADDGVHYFAHVFYTGACNYGYTVQQAAASALTQLYSHEGGYSNCQHYVVFGGSTRIA